MGSLVDGTVRAEGDLDVPGTMGVDRQAPVGFRNLRLMFEVDADASEEEVGARVATTERYWVVLQTLRKAPSITLGRAL